MDLLVSHVMLSIVVGAAGLCTGWWLHGRNSGDPTITGQVEEGLVRDLISSLHRLSTRMASDVGEHNTTVSDVDRELAEVQYQNTEKIGQLVERLISANRIVQTKLTATEGRLEDISEKMEDHALDARTDLLTGLANRRAFQEDSVRCVSRFQETDQALSLIMIDVDRFKQVNDVHGHLFGDEVLRGVAGILLDQFRGRDSVTRYGGEEFAILMPETGIDEARRVAERVREIIERTWFEHSAKRLSVTISLGVAEVRACEEMPEMLKRVDQALSAAKHSGRNRVYWHDGTVSHPLRSPVTRSPSETHRTDTTVPESPLERTPGPERTVSDEPNALAQPGSPRAKEVGESLEGPKSEDTESPVGTDVDLAVLNNVASKTMFCRDVHRRIAEFNRGGSGFTVILLSVDEDELDRPIDEPTRKMMMGIVANQSLGHVRELDFLARYDDSTFGMVLPEATLRSAICIGERLRKAVQGTPIELDSETVQFTVSLGIVENDEGDEMASLVERARGQLEKAQKGGGNRTGFLPSALLVT